MTPPPRSQSSPTPRFQVDPPPAFLAAVFAPVAAAAASGAAIVRFQLGALDVWREMLRAPFVTIPTLDPDALRVAVDNAIDAAAPGKPSDDAETDEGGEAKDGEDDKTEEELDETIEESFPASDPPGHNPGKANPPTE